ncbi:cold-shock protein [Neorhizobium alkalisoli]|uniref:CspA family cold shock protein n=1 Tax=Neorhizobium alkalisoli TaxID=528178 RepID=A0A561PYX6_9HYPH|nr:cold-shock protein [Neorhizobium alkalisoli]TWF43307.1 CspA family cold shock protein [Neorhizobium alkalisoli]
MRNALHSADNGGADAFVHISAVERAGMPEAIEGHKIGLELERDNKSGKISACNSRLLNSVYAFL